MATASSSSSRAALLSQWEQAEAPTAPITAKQRDSVQEIADRASVRPISKKIVVDSTSNAALPRHAAVPGAEDSETRSVESASQDGGVSASSSRPHPWLGDGKRIETGQQFLSWLHHVETSLQSEADAPYTNYIAQLERSKADADALLQKVNDGLGHLRLLGEQYSFVSTKSNALHTACQHLLQEQNVLSALAEQITQRLVFFAEADKMSVKLTSSSLSVNSDAFLELLDRLDECMVYVSEHPKYRESGSYQVRYKACLSRALSLIRSHVKAVLDAATSAASSGGGAKAATDSAFTLFYGKFRSQAPRVTKLLAALEQRTSGSERAVSSGSESPGLPPSLLQEYESALADCQAAFLSCRGVLLSPSVRSAVTELSNKYQRDHCGLVRASCAFLLHVCEDEYQLYHQFFQHDSENLSLFLEGLCQVLYDTLRPHVIQLVHLETLSELTGILRSEMLGHHCASHPAQLHAFEKIVTQLMEDVQERLVYRAYIYISTDIRGYSPAGGDLAYPEKLEMMEAIAEELQQQQQLSKGHQRQNSTSSLTSTTSLEVAQINGPKASSSYSPADLHGMWYPPVRRTLVCLSKLYRCLEQQIFQGLSQEALSACMESIAKAAAAISAQKTAADGQLFEIKHLLILREQIAPFHVDFSVRETSLDFSKLKTAAVSLLTTKRGQVLSLGSNNAILEFLLDGTPEVREYCRDSRKEVDKQLKTVCEQFIGHVTKDIVGPLQALLAKVEDHRKSDRSLNISREPWAKPELLQSDLSQCQRQLKKQFPAIQRAMQLYLANRETEFILFRPVKNNVMSTMMSFLQVTRQDYTPEEQSIIGCPSQEQIAVMITSLQLQPRTTPKTAFSRESSVAPETVEKKEEEAHPVSNGGHEAVKPDGDIPVSSPGLA